MYSYGSSLLEHNYQRAFIYSMTCRKLTKEKRKVKVNLYCQGLTLIGGDSKRIRLSYLMTD